MYNLNDLVINLYRFLFRLRIYIKDIELYDYLVIVKEQK